MLVIVAVSTLIASALTLFSGFGLGTLLSPVLMIFFAPAVAIALTAIVHLLNNLFKLMLWWRKINWPIALRFGLPAIVAAFAGAFLLKSLTEIPALVSYQLSGHQFEITSIKLIIAVLIIIFVFLEMMPWANQWNLPPKYLPLGGILSGFLGGLSGHQGALRSAFLIKSNLSKEEFIATGIIIACLVDVARLIVYGAAFHELSMEQHASTLIVAGVASFIGVFVGSKFVQKVTMTVVQRIVSIMLIIIALLLAAGMI